MATRAQVLADPRSGAAPLSGKAPAGRPPRDQGTRNELAASRARQRKRPSSSRTSPSSSRTRPPSPAPPATPAPATSAPAPAAAPSSAPVSPSAGASSAPPGGGRGSFTTEGAGAFLALFVYPLAINFLRGGRPRMWGWVKAKWINEPYAVAAPAGAGSAFAAARRGQQGPALALARKGR